MHHDAIIQLIEESGIVAIVRRATPFDIAPLARGLSGGGVRVLEITLNSHSALEAIGAARELALPDLVVGAGTVRTAVDAQLALDAGAEFLVAPNFDGAAVRVALGAGVPMLPGIATPSEAVAAWEAGCRLLKFFPAAALGANYLKLMRDPLPDIRFMATGGIDTGNLGDFIRAGAVAIGLGTSLVGKADEPETAVADRAARYVRAIAEARSV